MKQVTTSLEINEAVSKARLQGQKIAFVPTMGSLHAGHITLMREARQHGDIVVVSIFVNPTQFNDPKDFEKYPRELEKDLEKCRLAGVDIVFTPERKEMYPVCDMRTPPTLPAVALPLEGQFRPGHFLGVIDVVSRLFQIVQPHAALFGMKDYQQVRVIEDMVKERGFDVQIIRVPTMRTKEGLAMSSRNSRLSEEGLEQALALQKALKAAQFLYDKGERDAKAIEDKIRSGLARQEGIQLEYVAVVDADTLLPISKIEKPALVALAAFVEGVRLIDNCLLG